MLTFALFVFVVPSVVGAAVLGLVLWFERSPTAIEKPAEKPRPQGLVAGLVAYASSPGMRRVDTAD